MLRAVSMFDLLLMASLLIVCFAVLAALRRPGRRVRYGLIAIALIVGLASGTWWLANVVRGY
jgi:hypothetical protein